MDALKKEPVSSNEVQNDAKRQKVEHNSTSQKVEMSSMNKFAKTKKQVFYLKFYIYFYLECLNQYIVQQSD